MAQGTTTLAPRPRDVKRLTFVAVQATAREPLWCSLCHADCVGAVRVEAKGCPHWQVLCVACVKGLQGALAS